MWANRLLRKGLSNPKYIILVISVAFSLAVIVWRYKNKAFPSFRTWNNEIDDDPLGPSPCLKTEGRRHYVHSELFPKATCIDGSKPAFYFRNGTGNGVLKWIVFFEGGGWEYDLDGVIKHRLHSDLGSSKNYPECLSEAKMKHYVSNDKNQNPLMYNWNTVWVKYCDGGSYAGDRVVVHNGQTLHFKGRDNRLSTIHTLLMSFGMREAQEILLAGCSAGALGIYLGLDDMSALIKEHSIYSTVKVRGMADSGFFLDYTGDSRWRVRQRDDRGEAIIHGIMNYGAAMRNVFKFQGIRAGANPKCIENAQRLERDEADCIFAQNLAPHIETPLFALQPRFDQWQIWHVIGKPYNVSVVNEFGTTLLSLLKERLLESHTKAFKHGAFVDSCTHHCTSCSAPGEDSWSGINIKSTHQKINEATAFSRWYTDSHNTLNDHTTTLHYYIQEAPYPCNDCCLCHA